MTLRKEPSAIRNRKFDQAMLDASDAMMAGALAIRTPEEASRFIAKVGPQNLQRKDRAQHRETFPPAAIGRSGPRNFYRYDFLNQGRAAAFFQDRARGKTPNGGPVFYDGP